MSLLVSALLVVGAIALIILLPLLGIYLRRRVLDADGGVFDCDLRRRPFSPGVGWRPGIGRYAGDRLEWYRTFSCSLRPGVELSRLTTEVVGRREPSPDEAMVLMADQVVLTLADQRRGDRMLYEVAVSVGSAMALMAWLESSPPGVGLVRD